MTQLTKEASDPLGPLLLPRKCFFQLGFRDPPRREKNLPQSPPIPAFGGPFRINMLNFMHPADLMKNLCSPKP